MNDELAELRSKVDAVIYNPFVGLKDQMRDLKKLLTDTDKYKEQLLKLDTAQASLDAFESLPYGNLERIKGFNKIKSQILRIIRDLQPA